MLRGVVVWWGGLVGFLSASVFADVVELNNGDRLTGTIEGVAGGKVTVATEYAGAVAVDVTAVKSMTSDNALGVEAATGTRLVGKFDGSMAKNESIQIALADVATATRDIPAFETGRGPWESRADVAATVTSGNSDTQAYSIRGEGVKRNRDTRHRVAAAFNRNEDDSEVTKNETDVDYEFNWYFSDQWFFAANAEYFRDTIKDVEYRVTLGGGLGYLFYEVPTGRFAVEAGISAVFEELDSNSETNPAFRVASHFNHFFTDSLELYNDNQALILGDTDRGQIYNSTTGFRVRVSDNLDATASVDIRHETEPAPDRDKTDLTYLLGLGYRF